MKEITIASFQAKGIRLQLVVKNNNICLIKNRRKQRIDYPYREKWSKNDKYYHSFLSEIKSFLLNEVTWRIHEDGTFRDPEDLK